MPPLFSLNFILFIVLIFTDTFIKRYQTADFTNKLITARKFLVPIYFKRVLISNNKRQEDCWEFKYGLEL